MKLFSYIVALDHGFAPNPFFGTCTLATCKPVIRRVASIGDWVIGTGSSQNKRQNRQGYLVYAMCITEIMTFNEYWEDERFQRKKPNLRGSRKQVSGDNIYFKDDTGEWHQQHSYHSKKDGSPDPDHIQHDTKTNRVLLSKDYAYWGRSGREIPASFRDYNGSDICCTNRSHRSRFSNVIVKDFIAWFRSLKENGCIGEPNWPRTL